HDMQIRGRWREARFLPPQSSGAASRSASDLGWSRRRCAPSWPPIHLELDYVNVGGPLPRRRTCPTELRQIAGRASGVKCPWIQKCESCGNEIMRIVSPDGRL